ncbi:MAG: nicotinate-nucleotide adenylyltransferase [Pseudomonadota bacterium]
MARQGWPRAEGRMTVGLLGGSFDPPHSGHVHISREALKRLRLNAIWWLVTPGNPLKRDAPADLQRRMAAARGLVQHPRIHVSDLEARLGLTYTAETIDALRRHYPDVHFVWLMGADNLAQFHRWQNWRAIMETVPVAVMARPGERISARTSTAAQCYSFAKLPAAAAPVLARRAAPSWCFLNVPMRDISSSEIRRSGAWRA